MDRIIILQHSHQAIFRNSPSYKYFDIIDKTIEKQWDSFYNTYIGRGNQNTPLVWTKTGSTTYRQDTKLKVSLKYLKKLGRYQTGPNKQEIL